MQKGFNTDLNLHGKSYHIQTEDWGREKAFIVTRIFCNGAVLRTIKAPYAEVLKTGPVSESESIKNALRRQHQQAIESLQTPIQQPRIERVF